MNNEHDHLDSLRRALDQCRDELGPGTGGRLESARRQALVAAEKKRFWPKLLIPAAAMAMLALILFFGLHRRPLPLPDTAADAIEIINSGQDLDLYDQIDFYTWLAENHREI